jgi:hypothetical protein
MHAPPAEADEMGRDRSFHDAFRDLRRRLTWSQCLKAYAFDLGSVFYPFLPQYDATYAVLIPFLLVGLWASRRRRELWPIAGVVLTLSVIYTICGGPVSRYRFGMMPMLIILSGVGAARLRPRLLWPCASAWLALNLGLWAAGPRIREAVLALRDMLWR